MATVITPFLMFQNGESAEAMGVYTRLFGGEVTNQELWGEDGPGGLEGAGDVKIADIEIAGQRVRFSDSPIKHEFTLTPSFSMFVDVEDEAQLDRLIEALSEGGSVMMPKGDYGFSTQFAWVADRFGVSWQLNLP